MGIVGLVSGGAAWLDSTQAGTLGVHKHPYGTRAVDSSGGEYIYVKASTTVVPVTVGTRQGGAMVICLPGTDPWQATLVSTGNTPSTVQGALLGVQYSTANSTTQDCWIQVKGPMTVLLDSTAAAAGVALFQSTTVAGALSVTTTGTRLYGVYLQSSGGAGGAATGAPYLANAPTGFTLSVA
jgi:hypothetical protein